MAFPSPANAQEKWLYVSDVWDGSGSPVYTDYDNVIGNNVAANQDAVDLLLGYAYSQGYTGLFLYNMNRYMSGGVFDTSLTGTGANAKAVLQNFIGQATAMGLQVGGVTSCSLNSLDAFIDYNNNTLNPDEKFSCVVTENEWWWWSYNDLATGPCGELAFIQMKNNLNSRKTALTAAGLELYAYVGWARDIGYSYTGTYTCASGSAVRNGSTVAGQCELDQLVGIVDKFMIHDYVTTTPRYSYMQSRLAMVTQPMDVLWIVSSEPGFSAKFFEGKNSAGSVVYPKRGIEDAYDYISHNLGLTAPAQSGGPIAYDAESDVGIRTNINVIGITNFHYQWMANDTFRLDTANGSTIWVDAGPDQVSAVFPDSTTLAGSYLDDYLPIGSTHTISWTKVSGPTGATFNSSNTLTPTFNWTVPGIYVLRLTVSDGAVSASDTMTVTVTGSTTALTATISVDADEACPDDCSAILRANPVGGTGPYTYLWVPSNTTGVTKTGVCDGDTYSVTVTDSLGATYTETTTYNCPFSPMNVTFPSFQNVSTFGGADGEIEAAECCGNPPYQYSIDAGATWLPLIPTAGSHTFTGLTAGNYNVLSRDANACTATRSIQLTEPPAAPDIVITNVVRPACNTASNTGSIDITVSGGTPPYTYLWSTGATTQDISNLFTGSYSVTVTDSALEQARATLIVSVDGPVATAEVTNVSCYGLRDGAITVSVTGGTPAYTVVWPTLAQTGDTVTGLSTGNYTYIVYDGNGCSTTDTVTISQPSPISVSTVYSQPTSLLSSDGSIDLTVSGGTTPYTYLWSTGVTTQDLENLDAGTYTVTITDDNGCAVTRTITLFAEDRLQIAAIRAKCCMADLAYRYTKALKYGLPTTKCLKRNLKYLHMAVCLLGRYIDGDSCVESTDVTNLIEQINKICGCCTCDYDRTLFIDTL